MDLLATVRKEGSRGGRGDFKWSDVQTSSHRENYLGHSVMAPVGRWQRGRDLTWYSKADDDDNNTEDVAEKASRERKEELRRVKEAEQDAMARALGLPVPDRTNANLEEVSNKREFDKVLQAAVKDESNDGGAKGGRGVGFSNGTNRDGALELQGGERIDGTVEAGDKELQYALREYQRRHHGQDDRRSKRRSRSRSRDRNRDRSHRRRDRSREYRHDRHHHKRRHSSDIRERHQARRSKSRSRSRSRDRDRNRNQARDWEQDQSRGNERRYNDERSRSPGIRNRDTGRSERKRRYD